ncbi:HD domain-containing protein [Sediminibacterium sp.]|uniref:HD domain-containing protein n=1 Tax=Sediminibacterium sp. TaxID=1917865 RepID=UPI00273412E6|nr:HD domain-containing protein [Sediminibacterium sp.]MDP3392760.1 HD domain-containing protein [Sediminibacterium sp.]MDP3565882.1 HD domain-containing protein [Sediminibacterium sp.]
MERLIASEIAEEIIQLLLSNGGSEYIGEPVTKLEHMVQSAEIAAEKGLGEELIIAALLHDIGHICEPTTSENNMGGLGLHDHELLGGAFLQARGFADVVVQSVALHVPAKRYLCYKHPAYLALLSEASMQTLSFQGGPMSEEEANLFEQNPFLESILAIRKIDEEAKIPNKPLPQNLEPYKQMIIRHLQKSQIE